MSIAPSHPAGPSHQSFAKHWTNYDDENSMASKWRARRMGPVIEMVEEIYRRRGGGVGLDVGGRPAFWPKAVRQVFRRCKFKMIILNLPSDMPADNPDPSVFVLKVGDACDLGEYMGKIDLYHSNSVIEHIGEDTGDEEARKAGMAKFAEQALKAAPNVYVQTPDFLCPIEPHFISPFVHWLPRPWRPYLLRLCGFGYRGKTSSLEEARKKIKHAPKLLKYRAFKQLFPGCEIRREWLFGIPPIPKSLMAIKYEEGFAPR